MFARHLKVSCEEGPVTVQRLIRAQPTSEDLLRRGAEVMMIREEALGLLGRPERTLLTGMGNFRG